MRCPHCAARIGLFSDEMKQLGSTRACPRCGRGVVLGVRPLRFALGFAAVAGLALAFGVSGSVAAGVAGGVGAAAGLGLRRLRA